MNKIISIGIGVTFFCIQPCLAEMAQEVTIPGYNPQTASSIPAPAEPMTKVTAAPTVIQIPVQATEADLQQLIQSVDLSYWAGFASYLWTCTARNYTMPMYNAKNDIQKKFDEFKLKKQTLTKEEASRIAVTLGRPVDLQIIGLKGISCGVNIFVSNVLKPDTPYKLSCYFIMLDARYLSQLSRNVAANSGKKEVLPSDTLNAIQKLLNANCTQS